MSTKPLIPHAADPGFTRWDYHATIIHDRHIEGLEHALKVRGEQGWELVFMTSPIPNEYTCVFRRPVVQ